MSDQTDADRARDILDGLGLTPCDEGAIWSLASAFADERLRGIDIGLRNATSIDHYEVGHCCRLCGQTWPCDRAQTVGLS